MSQNPEISYIAVKDIKPKAKKVLLVSDENIFKNHGQALSFDIAEKLILKNPKADDKNLAKIAKKLANCDHIIAFGSGTINDLCKYTAAQKNLTYSIIPSSASMNGYLSKNASITIKGYKTTLAATLPTNVYCDLEIIRLAPMKLTKAGIGDLMCFYSCWFDWYLSHKLLGTKFDAKPFEILQPKMELFLKNYQKYSLQSKELLNILMEILFLSGQGMTMAGGSYPASQSEHMIAHTIEMKYPKIAAKLLHGEIIAVTTITSAKLQKQLLLAQEAKIKTKVADLENFFGKTVGKECLKSYEEKIATIKRSKKISKYLVEELKQIHLDEAKIKKVFKHFKIAMSLDKKISTKEYQECVKHAKFTRNRFTVLDFS